MSKAEGDLARVHRGLGGQHHRTEQQVRAWVKCIIGPNVDGPLPVTVGAQEGRPTLTLQREHAAIDTDAPHDGIDALATNLAGQLTAAAVLGLYKNQHLVELAHRAKKTS